MSKLSDPWSRAEAAKEVDTPVASTSVATPVLAAPTVVLEHLSAGVNRAADCVDWAPGSESDPPLLAWAAHRQARVIAAREPRCSPHSRNLPTPHSP